MASGNYGTIRPADVSPEDMQIFYHFTPSRSDIGDVQLIELNSNDIIKKVDNPTNPGQIFGGLYTLTLPTSIFNTKGIYTLIIKPREIRTKIIDCGTLSALPNIKGIVLDASSIDPQFLDKFENGGLVGYRVEYLSTDPVAKEKKVQNLFRIITSNNKAEPVSENLTNTTQKAIRYRFNDNSTLIFCTVSPSSAPNVKPNAQPYIGNPNQDIILTNTYFNPMMVEIEMVEHDAETLANGLFGNQTRSINDGIYTIYNSNNEIYKQYDLYEIKDDFGKSLFEVREERTTIDFSKDFNDISND